MSEPFLSEIRIWAFNYAPQGYAICSGQILPWRQNSGLFALIGNTFGGDGRDTFGLPDLQGRCPIGAGQGPGLSNYDLGQVGGGETHSLSYGEIPQHTHTVTATSDSATSAQPGGNRPARAVGAGNAYGTGASPVEMAAGTVMANSGGGQSHSNMQPFLTLTFCIALEGVFPSFP